MDIVVPVGRVLFASMFVLAGMNHFVSHAEVTRDARSKGVPAAGVMIALTGLMLLAGGWSVLLGYRVDIGGWILVAFLVPTSFVMHAFWQETDPARMEIERAHFLKNLSMTGAALLLTHFGSGPYGIG
ncbi:MAG: DoxX family protein [Gemmatimonadota bacterium]